MSQITFGSLFVVAILLFMTSCAVTTNSRTKKVPAYNRDVIFEKELKRLLVLTDNLNETVVVKSYEM